LALAENIRTRRAALKLSQVELAKKSGVSQQLINALEHGKISSTRFMPEIAAALGCSVAELDPRLSLAATAQPAAFYNRHVLGNELPVLAATEAEPGSMSIAISAEPVDFIDRPSLLQNVRESYALYVVDELMVPELEPGDIVLVNPHQPPVANTTCILVREVDGNKVAKIRRLTGFTASEWRVTRWNRTEEQAAEDSLNRAIWQKCHRIVGRIYRR
jgi:transcriptional regulator with XRE-family HTH domain